MLTKFVSIIGSYSPEVRSFGTLIMSTKVFSLIICKTLCQRPHYCALSKAKTNNKHTNLSKNVIYWYK